ncbi:hypothetical protein ADIS_4667 [Lunatimonas lonarensis]|uniref:Serine-threonine kinase receptor-associated protein n=1 Tax=Lunatimonas lonarensis TaxID=1232681 RepID=R7ZLC4_9BACT|nr:TIR domain-containing protein [Lunatimonas lonarensis]EON74872.1 hypothetical protein ADIS_4667 [Lunatimonas lonarensis]
MHPIFISYRRDDGSERAQLIAEHLKKNFGEDKVFLDTSRLNPGAHFPTELENAVKAAKLVIAMIGPNWRGTDKNTDRLKEEEDWVRKELELAIANTQTKIFPVFVNGAGAKESFDNLPDSINGISDPNAITLRNLEFERDILPLVGQIAKDLDLENPLKDHPYKDGKYRLPAIPFKGLEYFEEKDVRVFFGRGIEIRRLINFLVNSEVQILLFFGYSGVGKSSLLFAGLKPRLENKEWKVLYFRRDKDKDAFKEVLANTQSVEGNQLVILDQFEEIFTDPRENEQSEIEKRELIGLVSELVKNEQTKVMISFRKEYLAEIKKLFKEQVLEEEFLEPLNSKGILEAIEGITLSTEYTDTYALSYEENEKGEKLSHLIGQTILGDSTGNKAPLLQLLLRKMWDKVPQKPRRFTFQLFEEVKSQSLKEFVSEQLKSLAIEFQEESDSGLVLELLFYFTTVRGTSAQHPFEKLGMEFPKPRLRQVLEELKSLYILIEIDSTEPSKTIYRLGHDSLAPIVREMHDLSNLSGQKASRLLNSKKREIEDGESVEFSKTDIKTLEVGKLGMRAWTELEEKVFKENQERVSKEEKELEEKNIELSNRLARYYWEMGKRAKDSQDFLKYLFLAGKTINYTLSQDLITLLSFQVQNLIPKQRLIHTFNFGHNLVSEVYFDHYNRFILAKDLHGFCDLFKIINDPTVNKFIDEVGTFYGGIIDIQGHNLLTWRESQAKLWDLKQLKTKNCPIQFSSRIEGGYFDEKNNLFLIWDEFSIKIFDLGTLKVLNEIFFLTEITSAPILNFTNGIILFIDNEGTDIFELKSKVFLGKIYHKNLKDVIIDTDLNLIITWNEKEILFSDSKSLKTTKKLKINNENVFIQVLLFNSGQQFFTLTTSGKAKIWNSSNLKLVKSFNFITSRIIMAKEIDIVIFWNHSGKIKVYNILSLKLLYNPINHGGGVQEVKLDIVNNQIISKGNDFFIKIWDLLSGNRLDKSYKLADFPFGYANHKTLTLIWDISNNVKVWLNRLEKPKHLYSFEHEDRVIGSLFFENLMRLFTYDFKGTCYLWNLNNGKKLGEYKKNLGLNNLTINEESNFFLTVDDNKILSWELTSGRLLECFEISGDRIKGFNYFEDQNVILVWCFDRTLYLFRLYDNKTYKIYRDPLFDVKEAIFIKNYENILFWNNEGESKILRFDSRIFEDLYIEIIDFTERVFFKENNQWIFTISKEGILFIRDKLTFEKIEPQIEIAPENHKFSDLFDIKYNYEKELLVVCSRFYGTRIFDLKIPNPIFTPILTFQDSVYFDKNWERVLVYNEFVWYIFDLKSQFQLSPTIFNNDEITWAVFFENRDFVFTSHSSGKSRIWDLFSGEVVSQFEQKGHIFSVTFGCEERLWITSSIDRTAKVWEIDADLDFPTEHFFQQVEALTGNTLNEKTLELEVLEPELWKSKKEQYEKIAREHFKVCKHPKANWWASFNPEEAKKLRPEVEW